MAKWMTGPLSYKNPRDDRRGRREEDEGPDLPNLGTQTWAHGPIIRADGTEVLFPDPCGPDRRTQTWDDFANKAGRSRGIKCEVYDKATGSTADGHVGYMEKKRDKAWENFVEGGKKGFDQNSSSMVEQPTSVRENAAIERLNVLDSDEYSDGNSDKEGGPGSKDVAKLSSFAEHQKIKLDRLFDKCKDGRPVFIPEMPSKKPERDVNQVREFQHNIMGSCAGAGSGEFHSFRKSRRREYARQSILKYRDIRDKADKEYRDKVEKVQNVQDSKTAKKRAKRQKMKQKKKTKAKDGEEKKDESDKSDSDSSDAEKKEAEKPVLDDPYLDPLMQHPQGTPLVIPGVVSVLDPTDLGPCGELEGGEEGGYQPVDYADSEDSSDVGY